MEAVTGDAIPTGPEWQYEPKWDGFRTLAFRDDAELELQSKSAQSLTRYFPEVQQALLALKATKFVLDGEIVVPVDGNLAFDQLLQRIHPAESRIRKLASESPALYLVFDLLADANGKLLADRPLEERRAHLEDFAAHYLDGNASIKLSPATRELEEARKWFRTMGGGLDGIIAKELGQPYLSGERAGMQKIKNLRTADCVVGGFRYGAKHKQIGSLLLGLYDDQGLLNHVGYTSSIHAEDREELTKKVEKLVEPPGFTGPRPWWPQPLEPREIH